MTHFPISKSPSPLNSGHFSRLLTEGKQWYTPKEMAQVIGRTDQYVRDCFDSGRILGHTLSGKAHGREKRRSFQIHRDAVLLFLMETANYTPPDFLDHLRDLLRNRTATERQWLRQQLLGDTEKSASPLSRATKSAGA